MLQRRVVFEATIDEQVCIPHLLYLPERYHERPRFRWPLMLFLHGAGERGDDLDQVRRHGPPKLVEQRPLPFVILSPQCPADTTWLNLIDALAAFVEDALQRYRVDPARVYVTGLSMGGFGTWSLAAARPDLVAAIAPICGGGDWFRGFPQRALQLWRMPVWAFHGAKDSVVPPDGSRKLVDLLQALGGPARLTLYPDADHDSWTVTYENPDLYRWLLVQSLGPRPVPRAREVTAVDGALIRYWHAREAGYVISAPEGGWGLVPINHGAWRTLASVWTDEDALARQLEALALPAQLAPCVTAIMREQVAAADKGDAPGCEVAV